MNVMSAHPVIRRGGTWLLARCGCFVVMERSSAWHGRWWHPALAMVLMLTGFAFVALCHVWAGPGPGRVILILGLAPAAILGIPGLSGLVAAIAVSLCLIALRKPGLAQLLSETGFYLGALATWRYV